ncbi:MAG: gliding motility-associated C-terminal domain-containing protein [Bacteroidota bacterium]|nr:gliding motility-associated C-terminal domain-containing protein [Bacteroidota bacterium]MDP3144100.1 gliding motility-associated C-terminal domain-containing protein [Bacteroidota bacterium]MDP3558177.1 gliding motility-associated C-terminal domain-containing protein [Bacteroidota bacterium]
MYNLLLYKKLTLVFLCFLVKATLGQTSYSFIFSKLDEICVKGAAGIQIDTLKTNDQLTINWSNGQSNVFSIKDLETGDFSVHVVIKEQPDSVLITKIDTTIYFKIEKLDCPVVVSNHFTPNGDNYNDYLQIANIQFYPKFELYIFNKWGQQVHSQKENYTPWNGTWNGINVLDQTYYYIFYYDSGNKNKVLKGDITILR